MVKIKNGLDNPHLSTYLSPIAVWALAFGCAVGWGSFVMPGTTFLPIAGPLGTALGILTGGAIMLIVGVNYSRLMNRYPDSGGAYTFAKEILGGDHGFLCAWILLLTYIAIIWANSTAASLIVRNLLGDVLFFGFSYEIADYTVYFGEVLLAVALIAITCLICALGKRLAKWIQIICAVLLFGFVSACFIAVIIHRGGFAGMEPLFRASPSPSAQVFSIVILAPWAFIGFESVSHSAGEFNFKKKKIFPIIVVALVTSAMVYIMLTVCASAVHPDGFASWSDYISHLSSFEGIEGLPTFYAASQALGDAGLVLLGIAALCGIVTGLIGYYIALSRLIFSMSKDKMLPKSLSRCTKHGTPWTAMVSIAAVSALIPLLGRTAIGWLVDVTTVGATIVYAYVSVCSAVTGFREKRRSYVVFGFFGAAASLICVISYIVPNLAANGSLATESYLILIIWCLLGMVVFRLLLQRDNNRILGRSEIVWDVLISLILIVSVTWIHGTIKSKTIGVTNNINSLQNGLAQGARLPANSELVTNTNGMITEEINSLRVTTNMAILTQAILILAALLVVFSIFSLIKKREMTLEAEKKAAEQNSRAKSLFLSNMSHDIRTPMNAVTGYTTLALKEDNLPDNIREYLTKIDYSSKQLLSLINDILDMSRIESGKVELQTEPADLTSIFSETLSIFNLQMDSKNLTYNVDCSNIRDRYVICDKNRVNRILLNLISNAYKFTPAGGRIDVILRQLGAENGEGLYELTVSDNGIGMSPEFSKHIFDAFERERTSTVSHLQGTGLGMSITKSLVDLMDGSISVETEKDKGTKFTILLRFPITARSEVEHDDADADKPADFSGKRLLLVEDNPINREIAIEILGSVGFEIDSAENGKEAVEIIADSDPDKYNIILMDIQMPVMNGYQATRAIRAMEAPRSELPVIAITANTFDEDRREAEEAGMNAHISKPFDPGELMATLAKFVK